MKEILTPCSVDNDPCPALPTERPQNPFTTLSETLSGPSRTTLPEDMPHAPLRIALPEEGTALRRPTQRDWEVQVLTTMEVTQRFRDLADDAYPINQPLSAEGQAERTHILGVYRTHAFLEDLAIGEFDQDPALLRNQEYDSYYTDLRQYVSTSSPKAALALGMRTPQPPPSIALTIPPIYEPSDLPAYTATKLPPPYSPEVLGGHGTRDVPPCVAASCPVLRLGIEHSCGLYHRE
ncbi:MAG: hypothetical protein LQ345_003088 [Seirophora villosa]|nr:MAG: hypothetical protein LQ345_003088 [Seirophora villosa]